MALKDLLKNKLTKKELSLVPASFDIIGNREKAVAIIEIPKELKRKSAVATALMRQHKNVKSVLNKEAPRSGVYRTYKLKLIKGCKNTEVIHNESGFRFLLDPRKVYFSPRESTERVRIADKVNSKETVMVFFAGAGPFPVVLAKKAKCVVGIEINPKAIEYFRENIKLNKLNNVSAVLGDVKEKAKSYYGKCDRVLMPLPEKSADYLEYAIKCLKRKGMVHLYCFANREKTSEKKREIKAAANAKIAVKSVSRVLPYGPGIWKYRVDLAKQ